MTKWGRSLLHLRFIGDSFFDLIRPSRKTKDKVKRGKKRGWTKNQKAKRVPIMARLSLQQRRQLLGSPAGMPEAHRDYRTLALHQSQGPLLGLQCLEHLVDSACPRI